MLSNVYERTIRCMWTYGCLSLKVFYLHISGLTSVCNQGIILAPVLPPPKHVPEMTSLVVMWHVMHRKSWFVITGSVRVNPSTTVTMTTNTVQIWCAEQVPVKSLSVTPTGVNVGWSWTNVSEMTLIPVSIFIVTDSFLIRLALMENAGVSYTHVSK